MADPALLLDIDGVLVVSWQPVPGRWRRCARSAPPDFRSVPHEHDVTHPCVGRVDAAGCRPSAEIGVMLGVTTATIDRHIRSTTRR